MKCVTKLFLTLISSWRRNQNIIQNPKIKTFFQNFQMEEDKDSNENPADEVLKQIDMLQLTLIDFGEDENLTR